MTEWLTPTYTLYYVLVAQLCLTLCDPMDCSSPGSSVHGILQARILEWVAVSFSRESSQPRDWTQVSCTAGRFFTNWAILLQFVVLPFPDIVFFFFNKWNFCGSAMLSKSSGVIFPHFASLCHIMVILILFRTFSLLIYLVMVICDQWSLMLLLQKDYNLLKDLIMVSIFRNRILKL